MLPAVWGYIDIKADGLTFPHLGDGAVVAAAPGVLPLRDSNPHTPTEVALESCESARSNPQFEFALDQRTTSPRTLSARTQRMPSALNRCLVTSSEPFMSILRHASSITVTSKSSRNASSAE